MPAPIRNGTTTVELIAAVPFNGTTEQILFKNINDQNRYFSGRVLRGKYTNQQGQIIYTNVGFTKGSYQRYEYVLRLNINKEDLYDSANYMRFRNSDNHKWVYAYITDMHWNNSSECDIFFYIDSWQTYMFDVWWKPSLVERESVNEDDFGDNLETEQISFDNKIEKGYSLYFNPNGKYTLNTDLLNEWNVSETQAKRLSYCPITGYIVECSPDVDLSAWGVSTIQHKGIVQNRIASDNIYIFAPTAKAMEQFVKYINDKKPGSFGAIKNIYSVPLFPFLCAVPTSGEYYKIDGLHLQLFKVSFLTMNVYQLLSETNNIEYSEPIEVQTNEIEIPNYNLKNKKVAYYPQTTITLQTQSDKVTLKPEGFINTNGKIRLKFQLYFNIFYSSMTLYINNYDRVDFSSTTGTREGIYKVSLPLFPSVPSSGDASAQWWRQNSFRTISNLAMAGLSIAYGAGAFGENTLLGSILANDLALPSNSKGGNESNNRNKDYQLMGGVAGALSEVSKMYTASVTPDYEITSLNGIDVLGSGIQVVSVVISYPILDEAKQCDDYFSMYGYLIKKIKMPEFTQKITEKIKMGTQYGGTKFLTKRPYWYYIKTAICNISSFTQRSYPGNYDPHDRALLSNNQGLIPQEHLEVIKNMFNNGIRLWLFNDYTTNFDIKILDYSLDNSLPTE